MGWSDCGTDDRGRPIGYAFKARCDTKGCKERIDRGLSYVCGGMHLGGEHGCGGYFCADHLYISRFGQLCPRCTALAALKVAPKQIESELPACVVGRTTTRGPRTFWQLVEVAVNPIGERIICYKGPKGLIRLTEEGWRYGITEEHIIPRYDLRRDGTPIRGRDSCESV